MKLLVLGATGGTGREVIGQPLEQGHDVTAFVRDPSKMTSTNGRLRIVVGSVTGDEAVAQVTRGQGVFISALGVRQSFRSSNLISHSMRTTVPVMEGQGVRRLIVVSACGSAIRPARPRCSRGSCTACSSATSLPTRRPGGLPAPERPRLDAVYPVTLTDGPRTGTYRVGERLVLHGILPRIARADVADFILTQLASTAYRRKVAVISY